MAVGQQVMGDGFDVAVLHAVEADLAVLAADRGAGHGRRLRAALRLHATLSSAGAGFGTTAHLALMEQTSEQAATALLAQAELLAGLPGGLEAVDCGLLTVEQAAVVTRRLTALDPLVQHAVWQRLQARLLSAFEQAELLPPARLGEQLATWIVQADPADAVERRRQAERHGAVDYRQRDDGLADIFLTGISGPNAQAVLSRIRARSAPWGSDDSRSVDERRRDVAVDLLLGRDQLPLDDSTNPFDSPAGGWHCGPQCGCRLGQPVPCGIGVTVLVPIGAALGTTDEVARLEGHGPLEPDLLQAALHNAPVLRPVWVDDEGVPVSVGDRTEQPPRGDRQAVREALLRLAASRPSGPAVPRHPDDHPHPPAGPPQAPPFPTPSPALPATGASELDVTAASAGSPTSGPAGSSAPTRTASRPATGQGTVTAPGGSAFGAAVDVVLRWARRGDEPVVPERPHPAGSPGRYRPPTRLARLVRARAPRCEWPGCGHRSAHCDLDHDRAHPHGPTCGCNLGPLCRRHHRLKQVLLAKTRTEHAVVWTSPTGRRWTSPSQHTAPQPAVRALPALSRDEPEQDPWAEPDTSTDHAWHTGLVDQRREVHPPTDPQDLSDDEDDDPYEELSSYGWGLALDDPTRWSA